MKRLLLAVPLVAFVALTNTVNICHRTNGSSPYVNISINENALNAHLEHPWGPDVYPVPEGGCEGLNATPTPTATPAATDTPTATLQPTSTPTATEILAEDTPTATVATPTQDEIEPTATPTATATDPAATLQVPCPNPNSGQVCHGGSG